MSPLSSPQGILRFGDFDVDLHSGELCKHGIRIKLQVQPFQVLQVLLEHAGEVVTPEELLKRIWPADTFVDFDHCLNNAVKKLRNALGDDAGKPRFIETLSKRGYRFVGPVKELANGECEFAAPGATASKESANVVPDGGTARRIAFMGGMILAFSALTLLGLKMGIPKPTAKPSNECLHRQGWRCARFHES